MLFVSYAGYTSARDTLTALVNPAVGWNAYGWNAENVRIDASSVDDYLRDHVGDAEPIVRSTFDIYLKDNTLIYVREMCSGEDAWKRVYLHVVPVDRSDLPGIRKQYGNENFDFYIPRQGALLDGKCLGVSPLPDYDIASIHTGQHTGDTRSWQVTFRMDE